MSDISAVTAVEPRQVATGRGLDWITEGFALFKQAPGTWIGILLIWVVISGVLASISAEIVSSFINPIFQAGLMLGCLSLSKGEGLRVEHLFAGFRSGKVGALLLMSLILILLVIAAFLIAGLTVAGGLKGAWSGGELDFSQINPLSLLLAALIFLLLVLPLAMLVWFAPALIVFRQISAWDAMKLSLRGCLRNWLPFLVYGLVALIMLIVAAIPLLLGLLVALPVLIASVFASYRDIFPQ